MYTHISQVPYTCTFLRVTVYCGFCKQKEERFFLNVEVIFNSSVIHRLYQLIFADLDNGVLVYIVGLSIYPSKQRYSMPFILVSKWS